MILSLSDENFGKMVTGKTKAQQLFMSGKLKIKGNVMKGKFDSGVRRENCMLIRCDSDQDGADFGEGCACPSQVVEYSNRNIYHRYFALFDRYLMHIYVHVLQHSFPTTLVEYIQN